jgi:hypothetical protein
VLCLGLFFTMSDHADHSEGVPRGPLLQGSEQGVSKSVRWGETTTRTTIDEARKVLFDEGGAAGKVFGAGGGNGQTEGAWSRAGSGSMGVSDENDDDADYTDGPSNAHYVRPTGPPYIGGVLKHYDKIKVTDEFGYSEQHAKNPHAEIVDEYQYFERYCIVELDKAYFKVFSKEDDYWNPNRYNGPIHTAFLHSAKITETGRLVVDGKPHFTFSISSIGKVAGEASKGPQNFVFNLACTTRKQVREWVKALGKAIVTIADLPDVRHRVHKASRHKVNTDWKSKHLVIRHKNHKKGDYSRRKPSMENDVGEKTRSEAKTRGAKQSD